MEALYVPYQCRSFGKQQFCAEVFCALLFTLRRTGAARCFQNPGEYGASGDGTVKADGTHGVWQTAALVDKVKVDVGNMKVGDTIRVKDLEIAKDKEIDLSTDPEAVVATVTAVHNVVPETETEETAEE